MPSNDGSYVPLHVRHGSHIVKEAWKRGYDWMTTRNIQRLQGSGVLRALPVGWWLRGAGWCPTDGVLLHMLKRRGYAKVFVAAAGRPSPDAGAPS